MQNRDKATKLRIIYTRFQKQMSNAVLSYKTVERIGRPSWYKEQVINGMTIFLDGLNKNEKKVLWNALSEINEAMHPMTSTGYNIHIGAANQSDQSFIKALSEELEIIHRVNKQHENRRELAFKLLSLSLATQKENTVPLWELLPLDIKKYILNMLIDTPEKSTLQSSNMNSLKQEKLFGLSKQHMTSCVSLFFSNNEITRKTVKNAHDKQQVLVVTTSQKGSPGELTLRDKRPK